MTLEREILYDIFRGDISAKPVWLVAISGLSNAMAVMNRMAAKHRGHYFIVDQLESRVVAQVDSLEDRLSA